MLLLDALRLRGDAGDDVCLWCEVCVIRWLVHRRLGEGFVGVNECEVIEVSGWEVAVGDVK